MNIINTHSHVYSKEFDTCRDQIIQRAVDIGTTKILLPDIDSSHRKALFETARSYPTICIPMLGIHPTSIDASYKTEIELFTQATTEYQFCAIGEIGIDLYWDSTYKQEQIEVFEYQLHMAQKLQKPVAIHVRNSWTEVLELLEKFHGISGVFHCFSGTKEQAHTVIDKGFALGIGGVVTYKKTGLDEIIKHIDLEHIVVETDDPWLAPVPHRGKQNEPSYIIHVINTIANIKQLDAEYVARATSQNAIELFSLNK